MELTWAQYARHVHLSDDERSSLYRHVKAQLRRDGLDLVTADTLPTSVWHETVRKARWWKDVIRHEARPRAALIVSPHNHCDYYSRHTCQNCQKCCGGWTRTSV